ncbi:phosphatidylinositol N-acetylglucosaminyltransferase subunit A-like protein [Dinothrombium tinctorium]|uniref:phosphatidylinositol N-acetylglucosaminyltransferase n=1 Tax=Dinothrombium tinctorium TaxID=1965070 RepID=A0A443REJ9_9ACAR|nr:phosphatidylinositol N-acetylglucosaminyltransferase subunit A-like protein [Dinothrombium tinctorium]
MASDFFYPNTGGVENHIYQLSHCLITAGHKVIVITHAYDDRNGVRVLSNGVKVYYLPLLVVYNGCTLPTLFASFSIIRNILIRERIDIVHTHSAFSALAIETLIHANVIGIKTVFTDHSLFGFADLSAIITNKLLQISLLASNRVICVSHTGKENTALRAGVAPDKIFVISNAVNSDIFTPDPSQRDESKITVIVISRLVYRKGMDLLAALIPILCSKYSNLRFIISGDGPKRIALEEVVEQNQLQERVTFLGAVKHEEVRDVLVKGDIFLNCSLTEAFCMAIVEAASCGLQVVSTNVGGIPEVLPKELIWLTEPTVEALEDGFDAALEDRKCGKVVSPFEAHNWIKQYYQWNDIAKRTVAVYDDIKKDPKCSVRQHVRKIFKIGIVFGFVVLVLYVIEMMLNLFFSWYQPSKNIDIAPDIPAVANRHLEKRNGYSKIVDLNESHRLLRKRICNSSL